MGDAWKAIAAIAGSMAAASIANSASEASMWNASERTEQTRIRSEGEVKMHIADAEVEKCKLYVRQKQNEMDHEERMFQQWLDKMRE